jgi:hypothetical protein
MIVLFTVLFQKHTEQKLSMANLAPRLMMSSFCHTFMPSISFFRDTSF